MNSILKFRCFWLLLLISTVAITVLPSRADDIKPVRHKPNVKAWKMAREQGQKASEKKDWLEAEKSFQAALSEAENFDSEDYRLAESLTDLGLLYTTTGQFSEAEPLMRRAAEVRKGDPHPELEAQCNVILAVDCQQMGRYQDAEKAFLHAEDLYSRKFGRDHSAVTQTTYRRALLYLKMSDYAKAEPLLKSCIQKFELPPSRMVARKLDSAGYGNQVLVYNYKPQSTMALEALSRLVWLYKTQNRVAEEESVLKECLNLVEENASKNDPKLAETLQDIATFYISNTNYTAAESVSRRLFDLQKRKFGMSNNATLGAGGQLAAVYANEGKSDEAVAFYTELLPLEERSLGLGDTATQQTREYLIASYLKEGQYEKAEPLCRTVLTLCEKNPGSEADMIPALQRLETIDAKLSRDEDIVNVYKTQMSVLETLVGPNSPRLVLTLTKAAQASRKIHHEDEAKALEARIKAINAATAAPDAFK